MWRSWVCKTSGPRRRGLISEKSLSLCLEPQERRIATKVVRRGGIWCRASQVNVVAESASTHLPAFRLIEAEALDRCLRSVEGGGVQIGIGMDAARDELQMKVPGTNSNGSSTSSKSHLREFMVVHARR